MTETLADNTVTTRIPRQLRESDTHGKGAAEIGWGSPGDWSRCKMFLRRHGVAERMLDGACANLHKLATGEWPGRNAHKGAHALVLDYLIASATPAKLRRWEGPLAPIGVPTGDRRQFPAKTLTYQTFPMPLRWQEKGLPGHQGAVTVGVIEHAEEKDVNGKPLIWAHGYFLDPQIIPDVTKALHLAEHGVLGASVDLDSYTAVIKKDAFSGKAVAHAAEGRVRSATLVAIPAFSDLRLRLLDDEPAVVTASMESFAVNAAGWRGAPIAPREATFDADDAAKRIEAWANGDPNQMAKMFLWVDTENGPLLGRKGYRLPWGDIIDNKPYLIYHAIYAAAALLQDAHGGLPNIPDQQKGQLRTVITEIYQKLADEFNDPSVIAPWDHHDQQQQASGFRDPEDEYPEDNDDDEDSEFQEAEEYDAYRIAYDAALEEFLGRYTEHKHPRWPGKPGGRANPARNPKGGEWTDVKGHGPHGQIKVGNKWVYPPKKGEKGYKNPEAAVRAKAKRGAGKPAGKHSETRVVRKAKAKPEHKEHSKPAAPATREPEHHKAPAAKAAPKKPESPEGRVDMSPGSKPFEQIKRAKTREAAMDLVGHRGEGETRSRETINFDREAAGRIWDRRVESEESRDLKQARHDESRARNHALFEHDPARKAQYEREAARHQKRIQELEAKEHPEIHKKLGIGEPETKKPEPEKKSRPHKVSAAQERFLEQFRDNDTVEADENNATVKVLEREGYIEKTGGGTATKKVPAKKAPAKRTPAKKTGGDKVSKEDTGGEGAGGEGDTKAKKVPAKKETGTRVAKKTPARQKSLRQYRLTDKGREHLGIKGEQEAPKVEHGTETLLSERTTLRLVRDRGDEGMAFSDSELTSLAKGQLRDLESRGLLETRRHGRQERFHITDKGHEALKGHESEEPEGPPKKEAPGPKAKVVRRKTGEPREHKLTHAQQQALESMREEGWAPLHPGTRKVLEREGYVGSDGRLTQKGRDHLGIGNESKVETPKVEAKVAKKVRDQGAIADEARKILDGAATREEAAQKLDAMGLTVPQLRQLGKDLNITIPAKASKQQIRDTIVGLTTGRRLDSKAILPGDDGVSKALGRLKTAKTQEEAEKIIKDLSKAELIEVHEKLGAPKPQWQGTAGVYRDSIINHIEPDHKAFRRRNAEREKAEALAREQALGAYGQRLREADALARKSTVNPHVIADIVDRDGWSDMIKEDTGPLGIPVRNFLIYQGHGEYLIKSGRAIRRDGIVYLIEDHPTEHDHELRLKMLEAAMKALPEDAHKYQKSFVWARGANPSDAYWQKRFNNPGHSSLAMAGGGHTTVWRNGAGYSQERLIEPLRHEFGHNVDHEARFMGIGSGGNYYQDLAQQDGRWLEGRGGTPYGFVPHPLVHHPLQFLPDHKREVPYGVTTYGKSSWGEDFAESMALYLMGEMGYITRNGKRIPVYFRDMFPRRARVMDQLFPKVAEQQLDLVAKRGSLPD